MRLSLYVFAISLVTVNMSSAETIFNKELIIEPNKTETVIIATDVPLSFNAEFKNVSYKESQVCGNCLHIKNILQGSVNTAASNLGVGFIFVQPVDGNISVDVYHDYETPKIINVTATVYKGNFKLE